MYTLPSTSRASIAAWNDNAYATLSKHMSCTEADQLSYDHSFSTRSVTDIDTPHSMLVLVAEVVCDSQKAGARHFSLATRCRRDLPLTSFLKKA